MTSTVAETGLTLSQIENRLDYLENQIAHAGPNDLPALTAARERMLTALTMLVRN